MSGFLSYEEANRLNEQLRLAERALEGHPWDVPSMSAVETLGPRLAAIA